MSQWQITLTRDMRLTLQATLDNDEALIRWLLWAGNQVSKADPQDKKDNTMLWPESDNSEPQAENQASDPPVTLFP